MRTATGNCGSDSCKRTPSKEKIEQEKLNFLYPIIIISEEREQDACLSGIVMPIHARR